MLSRFIILLTFLFMLLLNTGVMAGEQKCGPIIKSKAPREHVEEQINKLTPILIAPDYAYLPASSQEVADLRKMHLDITRVFPDPDSPTTEHSLSGGFIVEAVVPRGLMAKLRSKGYDVEQMKGGLK